MRKLSEKIHYQFISGKINGAVYGYMQKIASGTSEDDVVIFDKHIKNLSAWNAETEQDCQDYFHIYAHAPRFLENLIANQLTAESANSLCKYAFLNRNKYNFSVAHNFTKLALDFLKEAHPNNMGIEGEAPVRPPYNVEKWIETMRYIYDAANTNNLPLDSVAKQVTAKWEENERINFQRWMRYYQEGNYNKYNVKTAQFFQSKQQEGKVPDLKQVSDLAGGKPDGFAFPKPDPTAEKQKRLDDARNKLRSRLKSVEEIVEKFRDVLPKDVSAIIRKDVYDLKEKILGLELKASIVDSINRTSNQMKKHGFIEGATELKKIAQEVAEDKLPTTPEKQTVPSPNPDIETPVIGAEPETPEGAEVVPAAPSADTSNIRIPEVNVGGEDDDIELPDFNTATHATALQKLEEINKKLSERNVVRSLAAVDIILGQLGIASYFPQLSEAQSKLMDAFNYAGSRVAETIGQMRGGMGGPTAQAPAKPKKDEDTIEVAEEAAKPVGEVVSGEPPAPAPKAPVK